MVAELFLSFFLTIFSVSVMSFISMASPVGPWIDVTLVLLGMFLVRIGYRKLSATRTTEILGYSTAASALGGSVATACGFAFPTFYFLHPEMFLALLHNPLSFVALIAALVIAAGGLGMLVAHLCAPVFLADTTMSFPIGQMVYGLMSVTSSMRKAYELIAGLAAAVMFSVVSFFTSFIPKKIVLLQSRTISVWQVPYLAIRSEWLLMLVAIGFVTGHVIAVPLAVGVLIKFLAADPLHQNFFCQLAADDFFFAFCSGIVLQSTFMSLVELPGYIYAFLKKRSGKRMNLTDYIALNTFQYGLLSSFFIGVLLLLWYLNFSFIAQWYLVITTVLCAYQIAIIGGKAGLAPVGRFATWVMVPFLMLFGFDPLQVTVVATFVEISGMVVVDTLFGRKVAQLAGLDPYKIARYQMAGLVLSAVLVGIVFWLLISYFGLGAASPLIAQRCQARALLINASHFNYVVMMIGVTCGFVLKYIHINSTLVLGGLLLPIDFSLLLIVGGLSSYLVKDRDTYVPFWSGVFAASALVMVLRSIW